MANPFKLLADLSKKPPLIPSEILKAQHLSNEDKMLIRRIGLTFSELRQDMLKDVQVQWDRQNLYRQIDRALNHWLVSSAMELFADYSTNFNQLHNASVWVTSENPTYAKVLNKLLQEVIGVEEKIFDWGYATGCYGNLFVKVNGLPGQGIVSVEDEDHPLAISRVDHEGILIGFYRTPLGQYTGEQKLLPPWDYIHFRLLGAKKKRATHGDPAQSEFRTMYLLSGMEQKQATTRYGTSLLMNALPIYRRLRLAEDSLLLARLTRGIVRYIWKLKVDSTNMEAVAELVDQYATLMKRARAIDISQDSPNYDSKFGMMSAIEDLFIPVWGNTGDLTYDEIGGKADIRWIVDIEELRNQLACALRCPLSLLGGFVKDAAGALGSEAIEKLDIRFARSSRRLQRALKNGITRMCQIHLAYMNMDPDSALFEVNMSETSTAEEESLKTALDTGIDIVGKVLDTLEGIEGLDKIKIVNYLNQKILKLEDFELENFTTKLGLDIEESKKEEKPEEKIKDKISHPIFNLDILSYLPVDLCEANARNLTSWLAIERHQEVWTDKFSDVYIKEVEEGEEVKEGSQLAFSW